MDQRPPHASSTVRRFLAAAGRKGNRVKAGQLPLTPETDAPPTAPASAVEFLQQIGSKGGRQGGRWKTMTPEQRSEHARKMLDARWAKIRAQREQQSTQAPLSEKNP